MQYRENGINVCQKWEITFLRNTGRHFLEILFVKILISFHPELHFFLASGSIWSVFSIYSRPRTRLILQIKALKVMFFSEILSVKICVSLHPELRFFPGTGSIWSVFSLYSRSRTCSWLKTLYLATNITEIWWYTVLLLLVHTFIPEVMDAGFRNLDRKIPQDFLHKLQCYTFLESSDLHSTSTVYTQSNIMV